MTIPNYKLIRSRRKTIGLSMTREDLVVHAPHRASIRSIEKVIEKNQSWIAKATLRQMEADQLVAKQGELSKEDIAELITRGKEIFPERVAHYASVVGVNLGRITVRCQKSKWGSCSKKGNLNFNCLLLLAPEEVLDAIVVHELCHLLEMNHSKRFYDEVLRVCPEYRKHQRWLKENGEVLMQRAATGRR